VVQTLW